MKSKRESRKTPEGSFEKSMQAVSEATDSHAERLIQKRKILAKRAMANRPQGNDEYEQDIAEDANFDTDQRIANEAFLISSRRDSAAGDTLSDWLQAEAKVVGFNISSLPERRNEATNDRRNDASRDRRISVP